MEIEISNYLAVKELTNSEKDAFVGILNAYIEKFPFRNSPSEIATLETGFAAGLYYQAIQVAVLVEALRMVQRKIEVCYLSSDEVAQIDAVLAKTEE